MGRAARLLIALLALLLVGWGLGALSRWALTDTDLRAVQAVASSRTPAQVTTARVLSWVGSGWVIVPLAALWGAVLAVRGRRPWALAICLSTVGAALIANLDKPLVGRPRPDVHPLDTALGASFPSGHAAQSAGFLVALVISLFALGVPRWVRLGAVAACALLALSIACSRIYLGVHYPSDVALGLLLGAAWSVIVIRSVAAPRAGNENDAPSRHPPRAGEMDAPANRARASLGSAGDPLRTGTCAVASALGRGTAAGGRSRVVVMSRRKRGRRSSGGWAPSPRRPVRRSRAAPRRPQGLLGEVRALLASGRPLDLIAHVSGLLAALDPRGDNPFEARGRRSRDQPTRDDLIRSFMAVPGRETAALLAVARGLIADEPVRQEIALELAARDEPLPAWLARLDEAEAYRAVETVHVLGDGENVIVGVRLAGGAELTALLYVDHNLGTVAKDGFILDEPLEETLRVLDGASDRDTRLAEIPLADARARITEAVDAGAITFPPFESDTWPMARPAIEWVARLLPPGGAGFSRPEWSDEAVDELADRFFASPHGRPLDAEDARGLLDSILWFGTDYGPGDPMRWSPVAIEILLLDWIPRKIVADAAYLAGVPRLLRAFVAFCNAERDIPARLGRETLAALDRLAPEYQRAIRTPRLQGPAAVLAAAGVLDADDADWLTGDAADDLPSYEEIMLDSLRRAVGGEEALARLDDRPLPDEPFDWAGVAEDIHGKVGEILALCDRCCDALLGPECRTACRRLLARAARGDPEVFRRPARSETAAAALVWAVGRANDSFGAATGRRAGEVSEYFGIRGSPTQRAKTLLRAAGVEDDTPYDLNLGSPELLIARRRRAIIERRDRYSAAG